MPPKTNPFFLPSSSGLLLLSRVKFLDGVFVDNLQLYFLFLDALHDARE